MKQSVTRRAPGLEKYKYWKSLTLRIARGTLRAGGNSGNTSSSNDSSEAVVNMRTTAVNTDDGNSSEDSSEETVTRTSNFLNEE